MILDEKQLIKYCLSNKEGALDELYKQYAPKLFAICLRYTKNKQEAEDLLHDGFIRILGHLKKFRHEGSFEGWMRRIIVTSAINYLRKAKKYDSNTDLDYIDNDAAFETPVLDLISMKELLGFINELPDGYRLVFNLYVIDGYKHKEIAEMLGISESTSKSQFMKARKSLQLTLKSVNFEMSGNRS